MMRPVHLVMVAALLVTGCDVSEPADISDSRGRREPGPLTLTIDGFGTFRGDASYHATESDTDSGHTAVLRVEAYRDPDQTPHAGEFGLTLSNVNPGQFPSYHRLDSRPASPFGRASLGFSIGDRQFASRDGHVIIDIGAGKLRGRFKARAEEFKVRAEEFTEPASVATGRHQILQGHFETDQLSLVCETLAGRQDIHHTSPFCQTVRATLEARVPLR